MPLYPATAILRTPDGPVPAFSLVPDWINEPQEIGRSVPICSGERVVSVSKVIAHSAASMVVLSSEIGWTAIAEGGETPKNITGLFGFSRIIGSKTQTMRSIDVQLDAFAAAAWLSSLPLADVNKFIAARYFFDLGVQPFTERSLRLVGNVCGTLHTKFTEGQMRLWVYTVLACLARFGCVRLPKNTVGGSTRISLRHTYYRDLLVWYLHAFGCRTSVRYMPSHTLVSIHSNRLSTLLDTFFSKGMKPELYELALLRKLVGKEFCIMSKDGKAHFSRSVDNTWDGCVEEVEVKAIPAPMRAISFPELGDAIIENNMLRVSYA